MTTPIPIPNTISDIDAMVVRQANESIISQNMAKITTYSKKKLHSTYSSPYNHIVALNPLSNSPNDECTGSGWKKTAGSCFKNGQWDSSRRVTRCNPGWYDSMSGNKCWPYCSTIPEYATWNTTIAKPYSATGLNTSLVAVPACKNQTEQKLYTEISLSLGFDLVFDLTKTRIVESSFDRVNDVYFGTLEFTINYAPKQNMTNSMQICFCMIPINASTDIAETDVSNSKPILGLNFISGSVTCRQRIVFPFGSRQSYGIPPCILNGITTTPIPMNLIIPTCSTLPPKQVTNRGVVITQTAPPSFANCNLRPLYTVPPLWQPAQDCTYAPRVYTTPSALVQNSSCAPFRLTIDLTTDNAKTLNDINAGIIGTFQAELTSYGNVINNSIISALNTAGLTVMC